jgi:hypothetical protein
MRTEKTTLRQNNILKSVAEIAAKDISQYLKENNILTHRVVDGKIMEVYVVSPDMLMNSRNRWLNRQLGLASLNYLGNQNSKRK